HVRSLWAAGAPGWRKVADLATLELVRLTRAAGHDGPDRELKRLCAITRRFVEAERRYHVIARRDKDAKKDFDLMPRIRRNHLLLKPLEQVIGDVHPLDLYYQRPDGTQQPLRLIGWQDGATNRLCGHVLFPEKGTGARMEHVAASFAHMVTAWGVPQTLYIDNGGEYNWAEFAEDAMRLCSEDGQRALIKALPYNAPAKKIESTFAVLERFHLSMVPGWIGGDRMARKTHNVGKAPVPFKGTPKELWDAVQQAIAHYNATPQKGLGGRSPDEAWADHVAAGWRPVAADMETLQTAFAREITREVRQGCITYKGQRFTAAALCRPGLGRVNVRVPVFGDPVLAVYDASGAFLCHAQPDVAFHPLDPAGAAESAQRKGEWNKGLAEMRREVKPVDLQAETAAFLALNPAATDSDPAGRLGLADEQAKAAAARGKLTPRQRREEAERQWSDMDRFAANMDRLLKAG
ncbi:MAG: hypothetical protein ACOC91_00595, partial [bacterium]